MLENKFKKQFREYLIRSKFQVHPIENKIVVGMPDLLIILGGWNTIWMELKTHTFITANQLAWIKRHPAEEVLMARYDQNYLRITRYIRAGTGGWEVIYEGELNLENDAIAMVIINQM